MKRNKIQKIALSLIILTIILTGCGQSSSGGSPGFIYKYLAIPGQYIMEWLSKYVGGYGWAVIVLTIIVRLILMPLMIKQIKQTTVQQEKMSFIRPQLKKLQKEQRNASSKEEQMAASQNMMKLYQQNNISMTGGIGCLPILIQLPIFAGLYAAIRYSNGLSHSVFMGIKLGQSSILLAILSFIVYILQAYISLSGVSAEQKKQMRFMLFINPIVILFVTLNAPAGLGIYFFIGGIFACIQTFIINLYRPKIKERIAKQVKENKASINADHKSNNRQINKSIQDTKKNMTNNSSIIHEQNRRRNNGKQNK